MSGPRASGFAKDYLRAVVDEIRVEGEAAAISGSCERLIAAVAKEKEDTVQVPSFVRDWRAAGVRPPPAQLEIAIAATTLVKRQSPLQTIGPDR